MSRSTLSSVTVISSPYHVGLRSSPTRRIGISEGPDYLKSQGLVSTIQSFGLPVHEVEIPPVGDDSKGEIGSTFELLRRVSVAVATARNTASFPIVLSGNCCTSVGVAAGLASFVEPLGREDEYGLGCVWFDAHDDYNIPDTVVSGYFDSQGIAMMAGECWKTLLSSIPGFRPLNLRRLIHCGIRDVNDMERRRVEGSGMGLIWGETNGKVDFAARLRGELDRRFAEAEDRPMLVHLDLDVLDDSLGKANDFACPGGLSEDDLVRCLQNITELTTPMAFTVASFDPICDGEAAAKRIAAVGILAVRTVLESLETKGLLASG